MKRLSLLLSFLYVTTSLYAADIERPTKRRKIEASSSHNNALVNCTEAPTFATYHRLKNPTSWKHATTICNRAINPNAYKRTFGRSIAPTTNQLIADNQNAESGDNFDETITVHQEKNDSFELNLSDQGINNVSNAHDAIAAIHRDLAVDPLGYENTRVVSPENRDSVRHRYPFMHVDVLDISGNRVTELPEGSFHNRSLSATPEETLRKITDPHYDNNKHIDPDFNEYVDQDTTPSYLNLANRNFDAFKTKLLRATCIKTVYVQNNLLSMLNIAAFPDPIRHIYANSNRITEVFSSDSAKILNQLCTLDLTHNNIQEVKPIVHLCPHLKILSLQKNPNLSVASALHYLPQLPDLEHLHLSANQFLPAEKEKLRTNMGNTNIVFHDTACPIDYMLHISDDSESDESYESESDENNDSDNSQPSTPAQDNFDFDAIIDDFYDN